MHQPASLFLYIPPFLAMFGFQVGNHVHVKTWGWPRGWQIPNPWGSEKIATAPSKDLQGRQMPHSCPGEWVLLKFTDALSPSSFSSIRMYNIPTLIRKAK